MRFPKVSTTNINGLPLGYTEVEYLQSSGTQYIDTGIGVKSNTVMKAIFSIASTATGRSYFGARNASNERFQIVNSIGIGGGYYLVNSVYPIANQKYEIEMHANGDMYLDGVKRNATNGTFSQVTFGRNLWLFATNYYDSSVGPGASTFYKLQILEGDVLVRDFIPCLDSNNRPCMYDRVEGKPYYNLGTGEFSYGRKIYGVEYLESTGTTQKISTGVIIDSLPITADTIISTSASYNPFYQVIIGTVTGNQYLLGLTSGDPTFATKYNNSTFDTTITPVANTKYRIQSTISDSFSTLNIDGTEHTTTKTYSAGNEEIGLFAQNYNMGSNRIYMCKLYKGNTLVRDYVPVRDENNVGYMLDKVSHTLYGNKGTGAFVVGKDTLGKSKAKLIRTKTTISGLPYGFKEVEYLESNGTQHIDTGIHPTDTYGYRVRNTYTAGAGEQCAIGCMDSGNRFVGIYTNGSANAISGAWGDYVGFLPNYTWSTGTILDVKGNYKNNRKLIIDSTELKDISDTHISGTIDSTVYLFARHYGSTITKMRGRIYSVEITNGQDVMYKFIPALDSNNRPCMYDIIEGKAYYNQGTGEFTYGPKIIPVEYLESTGTQYINTGIKLNNNFSIKLDYQLTQAVQSRTGLFGALNMTGSNQGRIGSILSPSNQQLEHGYGAGNDYWQQGMPDTNRHVIYQKKNETYFDGTLIHTFETATFSLVIDAYLGNFLFTNYTPAKAKYYSSQWWDGDTLIRDYIPVKDENGVGYMFDKVNHTLYANAGTGNFVVGDEKILSKVRFIEDTSEISEYTKVKCLISSGTQYIDVGLPGKNNMDFDYKVLFTKIDDTAQAVGGNWAETTTSNQSLYYGLVRANKNFAYHYGATAAPVVLMTTTPANTELIIQGHMWKGNQYFVINGNKGGEGTRTDTFTANINMWLFATNSVSPVYSFIKLYYFKLYDNGALVRDYIPVIRNSDNKPGMYDRVTKTFFTNQGTGEFTYETL